MPSSSRLKKIQEKKKQLRERTEKEIAERLAKLGPIAEPANMLTEEMDEDLLFEWTDSDFAHHHPIYSVPLRPRLCLLMQVMKVVFFFFVRVYLSVICSVVSVLEGAACLQICHCTEPTRDSVHYDNLSNKNINMFTRGLCVKFTKHSVWLVHISPQHFEPLHAVKLKVVVDVRECVSLCCGGPSRRWPHVTGGCCYLIRGCLPLYQKLLMKPCCNTLWSSQQSPEFHPNKDVINIQPVITVLLATILAFKCWNSLQSVTQAFAPTCKTLCVKCKEKKKGGGAWVTFFKSAGKHFVCLGNTTRWWMAATLHQNATFNTLSSATAGLSKRPVRLACTRS